MTNLQGKVAIVSGASSGIGTAIAKALAAEGASVVATYSSNPGGAATVVDAIVRSGGKALAAQADVSNADHVRRLVNITIEAFGRLDVLVNNAGVYELSPIATITEEQYRRMFDINVLGTLLMTQAAVPHLTEGSSIINISSNVTTGFWPGLAIYGATKGAVDVMTGVLANELGPRKIRVNAINPGLIETAGALNGGVLSPDFKNSIVARTPLGRTGQPEDIAALVVFLASDDARWLTGEKLLATGGLR
jgi:3-oxoacyl-[acyl-carrier protein] reductase